MPDVSSVEARWRDDVAASKHIILPGAREALSIHRLAECLLAHSSGDWGIVDTRDMVANTKAAVGRGRVLSAYAIDPDKPCKGYGENTFWIITEGDRSITKVLLPSEY